MSSAGIIIRHDRRPGDDALIVDLHRRGYGPEGERFRDEFCSFVAKTVADAGLDDPAAGKVWFAERQGTAVGCAAIVDCCERGQLRWVVVTPDGRGLGLGRALVEHVVAHARAHGYRQVFLETTDGLEASASIYHKLGFVTVHDALEPLWHGEGRLIVMELNL